MQNNGTWVQREQVQEEMGGVKGGGGVKYADTSIPWVKAFSLCQPAWSGSGYPLTADPSPCNLPAVLWSKLKGPRGSECCPPVHGVPVDQLVRTPVLAPYLRSFNPSLKDREAYIALQIGTVRWWWRWNVGREEGVGIMTERAGFEL